jgi:hypothetical protein
MVQYTAVIHPIKDGGPRCPGATKEISITKWHVRTISTLVGTGLARTNDNNRPRMREA